MNSDSTIKQRLDQLFFRIIDCNPVQRADLQKMWRVTRTKWAQLDQELIICRRQNKPTVRYIELENDIKERLELMDQYLTFAVLTK